MPWDKWPSRKRVKPGQVADTNFGLEVKGERGNSNSGERRKSDPSIRRNSSQLGTITIKPDSYDHYDMATLQGRIKSRLDSILNSNWFNALTGLVTTFALFGDDIRILAFTGRGPADMTFSIMNLIGMSIFSMEILGLCYVKAEYFNGFYFWLDLISTASMIFDIHWFSPGASEGSANVAKTGKVSKSAKGGRVVKIARLVRLVRIVKLFKAKKAFEQGDDEDADYDSEDDEEYVERQPSKVAKKLTELTTRHIIKILIIMVAAFPMFDDPTLFTPTINNYMAQGLEIIYDLRPTEISNSTIIDNSQYCFDDPLREFCLNLRHWTTYAGKLLYLKVDHYKYDEYLRSLYFHSQGKGPLKEGDPKPKSKKPKGNRESNKRKFTKKNKQCVNDPCAHKMRWNPRRDLLREKSQISKRYGWRKSTDLIIIATSKKRHTYAVFDNTHASEFDAMLNMIRMLVVMVVLMTAVIVFTQDATILVVGPIERMMNLVQRLAENPLGDLNRKRRTVDQNDETYLLEQTLAKISGLLQVGFGVAGAEVISKSMQTDSGTQRGSASAGSQGLNYMLPGKRITGVFGFAIIEDFTVTCSVLEEETCTFINTIAKIVHEAANAFHGAPNKNIGCAFLLVWKICDGMLPGLRDLRDSEPPPNTPEFRQWRTAQRASISIPSSGTHAASPPASPGKSSHGGGPPTTPGKSSHGVDRRMVQPLEMVESALAAFLKCQVDLHAANNKESGVLAKFTKHHQGMVKEFGDDHRVHMGFGLHIGWAIEGTIGSRYKIDASYLSPNVNTSARLEAATHMYKCPLLMSGFFVDELSPAARSFCRMIDVVSVKGSQVPLELWTFDVSNYPEHTLLPKYDSETNGHQLRVDFANDMYYRELQKGLDPVFMQNFNDAIQEYVAGDWKSAKAFLTESLKRYPDDGPSKIIMRVLAAEKFAAPPNWQGFRALTSKT